MSSTHVNLRSFSDEALKRAIILSMAMNAGHPDFLDTTEAGQIVWLDHDAESLFDAVLDEITRRVTERREPFEIDGFEAIGGKPDEVLIITPEAAQDALLPSGGGQLAADCAYRMLMRLGPENLGFFLRHEPDEDEEEDEDEDDNGKKRDDDDDNDDDNDDNEEGDDGYSVRPAATI